MDPHAIQLKNILVSEIEFSGYAGNVATEQVGEMAAEVQFEHTAYDNESKQIHLRGTAIVGEKNDALTVESVRANPFYLKVTVVGSFSVDESGFKPEYVADWVQINAPSLLFPYLREHVFSIAIRCGYTGVIMPLVTVPRYQNVVDNQQGG